MRLTSLLLLTLLLAATSRAQRVDSHLHEGTALHAHATSDTTDTFTVNIWSDIACPFCHLGRRQFELALTQFEHREHVQVVWRSFQLQPDLVTDTSKTMNAHLAETKGWSDDDIRGITAQIAARGSAIGLEYHFDRVRVANTRRAHRLLHVAREAGRQDVVKGMLLRANFGEGRNVDDVSTLVEIGRAAGLAVEGLREVLESDRLDGAIEQDIHAAEQVGARGVPFFVFGTTHAVSGAQGADVLLETLRAAWDAHAAPSKDARRSVGDQ
jgi:predicted DsbA family dithiol-disulfide isomerase